MNSEVRLSKFPKRKIRQRQNKQFQKNNLDRVRVSNFNFVFDTVRIRNFKKIRKTELELAISKKIVDRVRVSNFKNIDRIRVIN